MGFDEGLGGGVSSKFFTETQPLSKEGEEKVVVLEQKVHRILNKAEFVREEPVQLFSYTGPAAEQVAKAVVDVLILLAARRGRL